MERREDLRGVEAEAEAEAVVGAEAPLPLVQAQVPVRALGHKQVRELHLPLARRSRRNLLQTSYISSYNPEAA